MMFTYNKLLIRRKDTI